MYQEGVHGIMSAVTAAGVKYISAALMGRLKMHEWKMRESRLWNASSNTKGSSTTRRQSSVSTSVATFVTYIIIIS